MARNYSAEQKAAKVEAQRRRREALKAETPILASSVEAHPPVEALKPKTDEALKPAEAKTEQWRLDAQEYMRTGRLLPAVVPTPGFVRFVDQPHVPHDPKAPPWLGAGRGVVREYKGKRYVLVARHRGPLDVDALEHGVVTAQDHAARLNQRCEHKRAGWACHAC